MSGNVLGKAAHMGFVCTHESGVLCFFCLFGLWLTHCYEMFLTVLKHLVQIILIVIMTGLQFSKLTFVAVMLTYILLHYRVSYHKSTNMFLVSPCSLL